MSMKPDVVALHRHGRVLGTRALGAELAEELRRRIARADGTVLVDFGGVEVASSPVLDEIACALRASIHDNPRGAVILTGLNEDVRDTLTLVLQHREMMLSTLQEQKLELLGGRRHLEETLASAQELGRFTANDLAERLQVKLPNLHQRLAQLRAAGAVSRVEAPAGQRALVFATPSADELPSA